MIECCRVLWALEEMGLPCEMVGADHPRHGPQFCESPATSCHDYSVGDGDPAAIAAALQAIQQASIGCTMAMPTTDATR